MQFFQIQGCRPRRVHGLRGSAALFHITQSVPKAVITATDPSKLEDIRAGLLTFSPGARVWVLPPLDGSPFSFTPTHASTRRTRLITYHAILEGNWDYIITTPRNYLEVLPPPKELLNPRLTLRVGDCYDLSQLARDLTAMGYLSSDLVTQPGDFARRGGIVDIYSFVREVAFRLEFFDDELEDIRTFDPSTQRGTGREDEIDVLPLYEWVATEASVERFYKRGGELWNQTEARGRFLELVAQVRDRSRFPGYLHWTGLFHGEPFHFFDLLPPETTHFFLDWEEVSEHQEKLLRQLGQQEEAITGGKQLMASRRLLFGFDDCTAISLPEEADVQLLYQLKTDRVDEEHITQTVPNYNNDTTRLFEHWQPHAKRQAVVLVCRSAGLLKRFEEMLDDQGRPVHLLRFPLREAPEPGFYLANGALNTGFSWPDQKLVVISEGDVFAKVRKRAGKVSGKKIFHSEFRDLKIGDFVVHLDHGVGRFLGLVEMEAGGATHEMMSLEYRDGQKLYVNLNQLDLVQRYGSESGGVALDKLGSAGWERTKKRVKKAVRQMAEELIKLYAQRQMVGAHTYGVDTEWQMEFEESFEFEATSGQLAAVRDIKADLESQRPMDRLLVGDVGFGKTEVAMRTAFKVVMEGFQVAVLCPTTVLAFQHFHTFKNRFAAFPITIRHVSRFTSTTQVKQTLEEVTAGKVDIIIGTHRILSKDVQFKKLGALIIDEEQRFGVSHKERLKQMRKQLDVLSMSATPIPRTLNLSLSGIRDISVIETPPRNRLAINTTVAEAREGLLKNAIEFELDREGQVFFIHNRVESMETVARQLKKLVPRAKIEMAHGQMDAKRIERVMLAFMKREIDILVASTIIENGVDIPNANTMLVNRADMFGMSQLYQLRGRIGRGDRPAYAYLLVPPSARMTALARKRLATLEEFSDLGSGFRIAAMDMELRGAGNLLGAEQAGHINAIGYETYIKLLNEAVEEMKGTPIEDRIHCILKLNLGSSLPKTYIEETNQRLSYYKKLAGARKQEEIERIRETLRDMFGPLPEAAELLCKEHQLRIELGEAGVLGAEREKDKLKMRFHPEANVDAQVIFDWVRTRRDVSVSPDGLITVPLEATDPESIMAAIRADVASLRK